MITTIKEGGSLRAALFLYKKSAAKTDSGYGYRGTLSYFITA